MSGGAPVILTAEELATREARTVVMVSSEEILPRKIKAYSANKSEISFMFRQPSASAIMINKPFIELELQFIVESSAAHNATDYHESRPFGGSTVTWDAHNGQILQTYNMFGRAMEGLPFLSKCVRTSVISINGATQTYRNSEMLVPYLRTQVGREAMKKINVGWNSMQSLRNGVNHGMSIQFEVNTLTENDSEQATQFKLQNTMDGTSNGNVFTQVGATRRAMSQKITIREPLFMSIFGGLQGNDAFPLWSCEQNKSPSILHAQQVTINLNLLDNWAQNLYGMIQTSS